MNGSSDDVTTMRITVVDETGALSFLAPPYVMKMLAAACSAAPRGHRSLFEHAETYDPRFFRELLAELDGTPPLGAGDEEPLPSESPAHRAPAPDAPTPDADRLVFRVVDESTRRRSLDPGDVGLIVYNLAAKRIVLIHNSYSDLLRRDRGRLRRDGRPVRALYRYSLADEWSIVP